MSYDLRSAARRTALEHGFHPDIPEAAVRQAEQLGNRLPPFDADVRDLRSLPWSSIDNDTSRDLDQIEFVEKLPDGLCRILVGIADVDSCVGIGSPIDQHAASETATLYADVVTFPMLPEALSTGLTSLLPNEDRLAVVTEIHVHPDGSVDGVSCYRALARNRAQLTYNSVGPWLEGASATPLKAAELADQLRLQDRVASLLRERRHQLGALAFDRVETESVVRDGQVAELVTRHKNRAGSLIEDFMIAANEAMARTLREKGVASIRRVVSAPARWDRIVELASRVGEKLPAQPDAQALNEFLLRRKAADPTHYADISLAVIKLLGPGEYVVLKPGEEATGHFSLATNDYTHSTAPNRRFADVVTQRILKAILSGAAQPYSVDELGVIAKHCSEREDAARKVERTMRKRVAAVALSHRVGDTFLAIATGASPKGTYVRTIEPVVEGRLMQGIEDVDVGDKLEVRLTRTDPERGFIDFVKIRELPRN